MNQKIGLNALLWTVPVQVEGIGKPIQTSKQIIVTDESFKSYYKIVFVVLIAVCVYLTFTFAYKRYKKWKIKQYTSSEEK